MSGHVIKHVQQIRITCARFDLAEENKKDPLHTTVMWFSGSMWRVLQFVIYAA
ncbi:MAG: hypothetical protein K0U68_01275 [Gammaproteobacteria bacterium]|nr:hypothetical protein [Gammaproteobacteria bacterium]